MLFVNYSLQTKVVLTFRSVDEILKSAIGNENYSLVPSFGAVFMLHKVIQPFDSVDEILN